MWGDEHPLSWQVVAASFLGCLLLTTRGLLSASPEHGISPAVQGIWWAGCGTFLLLIAGHALTHRRGAPQPDVLAGHFPVNHIWQAGAAHFVLSYRQESGRLNIELLAQNLYDGPSRFSFRAVPLASWGELRVPPTPRLVATLPGSSVVRASVALPLHGCSRETVLPVRLRARCRGSGRKVRFRGGRAVRGGLAPWVNTLGLLVGQMHFLQEATTLNVHLRVAGGAGACSTGTDWALETVWLPGDPQPRDLVR